MEADGGVDAELVGDAGDAGFEIVIVDAGDGDGERLPAARFGLDIVGLGAADEEEEGDVVAGAVGVVFGIDDAGGLLSEPAERERERRTGRGGLEGEGGVRVVGGDEPIALGLG